jgi:ubiquitin-protein ligase
MGESKLNKQLYTDVNRLRLCNKSDAPVRFILDKSPFNEEGEQEEAAATASSSKEIIILGRIFPNSEIYKDGAYQIEMKLTSTYPFDPPEVRFVTKIYHPNVGQDGKVN